jgi:hypothetical protein
MRANLARTHRSGRKAGAHIRTFCRLADDVLLGEPLPLAIAQQVIEQCRFSGTQKAESTVTGKRSGA